MTAGYPETVESEDTVTNEDGATMVGANSAVLYAPDGTYIGGYRKTNMFITDKTWAKPGEIENTSL